MKNLPAVVRHGAWLNALWMTAGWWPVPQLFHGLIPFVSRPLDPRTAVVTVLGIVAAAGFLINWAKPKDGSR